MHAPEPSVLVVDVQADLLANLGRRVVVPLLLPADMPSPVRDLHPVIQLEDMQYRLATHLIASVRTRELGRPVGTIAHHRDDITRALDMLLTGF